MDQPQMNQPQSSQAPPPTDTSGFVLIEQLLREQVTGNRETTEALIAAPIEALKNASTTPRLQRQSEAVAAGFEKTRELLNILSQGSDT